MNSSHWLKPAPSVPVPFSPLRVYAAPNVYHLHRFGTIVPHAGSQGGGEVKEEV